MHHEYMYTHVCMYMYTLQYNRETTSMHINSKHYIYIHVVEKDYMYTDTNTTPGFELRLRGAQQLAGQSLSLSVVGLCCIQDG